MTGPTSASFASEIHEGERFLFDTERAQTIHPDYARRVVSLLVDTLQQAGKGFAILNEMAELRRADEQVTTLITEMREYAKRYWADGPRASVLIDWAERLEANLNGSCVSVPAPTTEHRLDRVELMVATLQRIREWAETEAPGWTHMIDAALATP